MGHLIEKYCVLGSLVWNATLPKMAPPAAKQARPPPYRNQTQPRVSTGFLRPKLGTSHEGAPSSPPPPAPCSTSASTTIAAMASQELVTDATHAETHWRRHRAVLTYVPKGPSSVHTWSSCSWTAVPSTMLQKADTSAKDRIVVHRHPAT